MNISSQGLQVTTLPVARTAVSLNAACMSRQTVRQVPSLDSLQGLQVAAHLGAGAEQRLLHRRREPHKVLERRQHVQAGQAAALVPAHNSTVSLACPARRNLGCVLAAWHACSAVQPALAAQPLVSQNTQFENACTYMHKNEHGVTQVRQGLQNMILHPVISRAQCSCLCVGVVKEVP